MSYRNRKILALAKEAPCCMSCGRYNVGHETGEGETLVACHSNSLMHNKGTRIKADDLTCYLCGDCHAILDGRTNSGLIEMTRKDKQLMFYDAFYKTMLWLLESGHLHVSCGNCKCEEVA